MMSCSLPRHRFGLGVLFLFLLLAACTNAAEQVKNASAPATLTLISATKTPLPSSTATLTPPVTIPNPLDILPPQATISVPRRLPAGVNLILKAAFDDAEAHFEIPENSLHVLGLKLLVWNQPELDCDDVGTKAEQAARNRIDGGLGYRLILGSEEQDLIMVYHAKLEGELLLCENSNLLDTTGSPLYIDPVTLELVELAREDLAQKLDVTANRIQPVDVLTMTWLDTSLGCPQESGNYTARLIPGYRVLFRFIKTYYAYHTDFLSIHFCPLEREQLPQPFVPTPSPTPSLTPLPTAIP